jgi:hypothetical protein
MRLIGDRLIAIEKMSPGVVRLRANPFMVSRAVDTLRRAGFKKSFLRSGQQFIFDAFLSHPRAAQVLLPFTLLAGGQESPGHISCWNGFGEYGGWQGVIQLGDFASGNKMRLVLIVNCEPFIAQIGDLLDPVPTGEPVDESSWTPESEWWGFVANMLEDMLIGGGLATLGDALVYVRADDNGVSAVSASSGKRPHAPNPSEARVWCFVSEAAEWNEIQGMLSTMAMLGPLEPALIQMPVDLLARSIAALLIARSNGSSVAR